MTPPAATAPLPPVAADVVAEAVEGLTSRLRKKLDAAIEQHAATRAAKDGDTISVNCGEDAVVTLTPGPSGSVTKSDQAQCTCLLAPRCLHRAAVLSACPIADPDADSVTDPVTNPVTEIVNLVADPTTDPGADFAESLTADGPSTAQVAAATVLWSAAAAALAAGIPAAGAVPQAELLRAAHTARLAGLHRAEAAALRVARGLREARARHDGHRLADLVSALRELLLTTGLLAAADPDPALIGTARRAYESGGGLRVHGVCREPVISATGYGGVVTHLLADDGRWYSAADVKPGGSARARAAATAPVTIGTTTLDHAQLARGGLLITGASVSPEGRLGSGKGVRAKPIAGISWSTGPLAALLARPLADAAATRLSSLAGDDQEQLEAARELVACDVMITGAQGDHVLAQELTPVQEDEPPTNRQDAAEFGTLLRLLPADGHPELAHTANLRQLASRPGLRIRVVGRLDPDRAATLRPLAVGPVPGTEATLRLPEGWLERADLGYDRLQGSHLPPLSACPPTAPIVDATLLHPTAESPLWRYRHLVELAVSGGRRAVAEFARAQATKGAGRSQLGGPGTSFVPLRVAGFHAAADLAGRLTREADRRDRDAFGRLTDPDPDRYAWAWLAAAAHLAATERALVLASWRAVAPQPATE